MSAFQFALMLVSALLAARANKTGQTSQAVATAIVGLQQLIADLRASAKQSHELTDEEDAIITMQEEAVMNSKAADPDANQ
jgi:hypothetical protein